jgi:Peptidase M10 serralysin C terminal
MYTAADLYLLRASNPNPIPGIDTVTGVPPSAYPLKSYTTLTTNTSAPVYYVPSLNRVVVQGSGTVAKPLVLSGYDFSGAYVQVYGNNVTIQDSFFNNAGGKLATVQLMNTGATGLTVQNCTFSGGNNFDAILGNPNGYMAVINNSFIDSACHPLTLANGIVTGNYFSGGGYLPGVHADAISIQGTSGPVTVSNNFIDWTNNAHAATWTGSAIRIATDGGNTSNVSVTGNVILGGGWTIYAQPTRINNVGLGCTGVVGQIGTLSNVNISGNYIGFGNAGALYATPAPGVSFTGNSIVDYTNPAYSINAWNAYLAYGAANHLANDVGTPYLVSSTGGNIIGNPAGSTTLYGAGHLIDMYGSTSETVFIGGAGSQYMVGGFGANIFKYLAISDSVATHPDSILGNFDPAKDVFDLSAINADPQGAMQNFTFIGTAPFSGSAGQVRYQYNPSTNQTLVQAELVGDSIAIAGSDKADFQIKLSGNVTLTAANFALTAAQSSADMAAGSALHMAIVGASNAPHELVYTNVQNRSYSSFTEIFPAGSTVVGNEAAEAFNNTDGTGSLTLSGANVMYAGSGSSQTVTVGGTAFSINAHATETINTTGASDSFVFKNGFGQDTLNGFGGSDTLQLQKSMFSYIDRSASQSVDLAAVIAHASFGAGSATIADTSGDHLTLSGFTSTTLAAASAQISFV